MAILSSCVVRTTHAPSAVFSRWADPESWPEWDPEVRRVSFEGPVQVGARGRLRPRSGPGTSFSVTAVERDREFTNASPMPGAMLTFEHLVSPAADGAEVAVTVRLDGPLAPLWARLVGRGMSDAARSSVSGLLAHLDAA
ncbi:MAG: SRPBCC family protein [Micropruina sp.]|nr:SRPBCC family protein [Micropruina sp.]